MAFGILCRRESGYRHHWNRPSAAGSMLSTNIITPELLLSPILIRSHEYAGDTLEKIAQKSRHHQNQVYPWWLAKYLLKHLVFEQRQGKEMPLSCCSASGRWKTGGEQHQLAVTVSDIQMNIIPGGLICPVFTRQRTCFYRNWKPVICCSNKDGSWNIRR